MATATTTQAIPATMQRLGANRAWAVLALSILIFGVNWPVLKIALRSIPPLWLADLRMLGAAILYALPLLAAGRLAWPKRSDLRMVAVLGIFQGALMMGFTTMGLQTVGAGRSAILCYTTPIWIIPGAILLLGERITRFQVVGLACGLAGVAILFNPLDFDWHARATLVGNMYCLLAALSWSVALLHVRGHRWQTDPIELMPLQSLLGWLVMLPVAMIREGAVPHIAWSLDSALAFSYITVLATTIAFWSLVVAARRLPAIGVSLAQLSTPVIGVAAAAIWIGEVPAVGDLLGLGLIILGVAVASLFGRPRTG